MRQTASIPLLLQDHATTMNSDVTTVHVYHVIIYAMGSEIVPPVKTKLSLHATVILLQHQELYQHHQIATVSVRISIMNVVTERVSTGVACVTGIKIVREGRTKIQDIVTEHVLLDWYNVQKMIRVSTRAGSVMERTIVLQAVMKKLAAFVPQEDFVVMTVNV